MYANQFVNINVFSCSKSCQTHREMYPAHFRLCWGKTPGKSGKVWERTIEMWWMILMDMATSQSVWGHVSSLWLFCTWKYQAVEMTTRNRMLFSHNPTVLAKPQIMQTLKIWFWHHNLTLPETVRLLTQKGNSSGCLSPGMDMKTFRCQST